MAQERMSRVDHAWLRMDHPDNWMIITGLMTLGSPISIDRLKILVESRLLQHRRFRQRPVWPRLTGGRPYWKDDAQFDLDRHVTRVRLPKPAGQAELQALVSELMSYGLDYDRPLWHLYLIENYEHGSAVIARLHHCLADGIALVRVLLSMADTSPQSGEPGYEQSLSIAVTSPREAESDWLGLNTLPQKVASAAQAADTITRAGVRALRDPSYLKDTLERGADLLVAAGRLALRWPDQATPFKGSLGEAKQAAWSAPLALSDIKQVGLAYGATINDVLLTAVTGALRRYLIDRNELVEGISIRGVVPVNLRPMEDKIEMGNKFGLVFLGLPLGIKDPLERLRALKRNMDALKGTQEAVASFGILGIIGSAPEWLQAISVSIFDAKGTAVMTNVPGPRVALYLAGAPIQTMMAWVPQSGRVALGISIISYNGSVWLGIATDQQLTPDPERIVDYFTGEFAAMQTGAAKRMHKRQGSLQAYMAQLDNSLDALDSLLEQSGTASAGLERAHCSASTRRGQPCRNQALPGQSYCRVHAGKSNDLKD